MIGEYARGARKLSVRVKSVVCTLFTPPKDTTKPLFDQRRAEKRSAHGTFVHQQDGRSSSGNNRRQLAFGHEYQRDNHLLKPTLKSRSIRVVKGGTPTAQVT